MARKKLKCKKMRGKTNWGRGKKAGRGAGLRGGRGNAGLHKHKYMMTVKWENEGYRHFGRVGFKRPVEVVTADTVVNVGVLAERFPGASEIDLAQHGFTKLLGAGTIDVPVKVKVAKASGSAVAKIEEAGGTVTLLEAGSAEE